jgi:uncharacterized protein YkwD
MSQPEEPVKPGDPTGVKVTPRSTSPIDIYTWTSGDGWNTEEQKLYNLVNDYREANGLDDIPASRALSIVANRHVVDLAENIGEVTHSWSDAPYSSDDSSTWPNMWGAPQRFTNYPGNGYENAFGGSGGYVATAEDALTGWQGSPGHNNVILNRDIWIDLDWEALGVGIYEGYAVLWFGEETDSSGKPELETQGNTELDDRRDDNITGTPPSSQGTSPAVRRFNDLLSGVHIYTSNETEIDRYRSQSNVYREENTTFMDQGDTRVYRFFDSGAGSYFYTSSQLEADSVQRNLPQFQLLDESQGFEAYSNQNSTVGLTPIYRFFNTDVGGHFFTTSSFEAQVVRDTFSNMREEVSGFYVLTA